MLACSTPFWAAVASISHTSYLSFEISWGYSKVFKEEKKSVQHSKCEPTVSRIFTWAFGYYRYFRQHKYWDVAESCPKINHRALLNLICVRIYIYRKSVLQSPRQSPVQMNAKVFWRVARLFSLFKFLYYPIFVVWKFKRNLAGSKCN